MATKNFLLHLAKTGFRNPDADGIQLEDDTRGTIILDGVEPFPANVFFVQETNGDNILLESNVSPETNRLLHETSIVTFNASQVLSVGEKLLQNNPINESTIPLSEFINIPFSDIRRESRLITEQPSDLLENDKLTPKFIA